MDEFDLLVEQQDQEIALDGFVSPAIQTAFGKLAEQEEDLS
jgi:hypothetical protein